MTTEDDIEQEQSDQAKPLKLRDYADFEAATNQLVIPIYGKDYRIPDVGIRTATLLIGISAKKAEPPAEWSDGSDTYYRDLLGSAYDEMFADNVPSPVMPRVALTVWTDVVHGRAAAYGQWELSNNPEAWAAQMAAQEQESPAPRKSATKRAATTGTSKANRSSTSTSRAARTRTSAKAQPARRGRTSSSTGSNSKATS